MKSKAVFAWGREEAGMEEGLPRGRKKLLRVKDLFIILITGMVLSSPGGSVVKKKNFHTNAGDSGCIPGWGRSPGKGNGNPLQYSCLENSMDRGAWWATVHGVAKSQTLLSDETTAMVVLWIYNMSKLLLHFKYMLIFVNMSIILQFVV